MKLVTQISQKKDKIQSFLSTEFISELHDHQQLESEHEWMQPVVYRDFFTGEKSFTVIFGTDRSIQLGREIMDLMVEGDVLSFVVCELSPLHPFQHPNISLTFSLSWFSL
jgi:hypothetical protein